MPGNGCANVATDDIKPLIALRRETSEVEYIAFMRERFGFKPAVKDANAEAG